MNVSARLPIIALIEERSAALGLKRTDLIRRAGLKNVPKGLRRLDQLKRGELDGAVALLAGLPAALELPPEVIHAAILETEEQLAQAREIEERERDALWRERFKPCAYLIGTTKVPSQICICGVTGGPARWLKIPLDLTQSPDTFSAQALAFVRRTPQTMFFGRTTGFVVNFDPDRAVRFDLDGNPLEHLNHADIPGHVVFTLGRGRHQIPSEVLAKVMGLSPK